MDIKIIKEAIKELEQSDTIVDNIQELASLYIVAQNMEQGLNPVVTELNEILPAYNRYIQVKRKYQLGEITEEPVCTNIKQVCAEIRDFMCTLYAGTDMGKERRCIRALIQELYEKYVEKPIK